MVNGELFEAGVNEITHEEINILCVITDVEVTKNKYGEKGNRDEF